MNSKSASTSTSESKSNLSSAGKVSSLLSFFSTLSISSDSNSNSKFNSISNVNATSTHTSPSSSSSKANDNKVISSSQSTSKSKNSSSSSSSSGIINPKPDPTSIQSCSSSSTSTSSSFNSSELMSKRSASVPLEGKQVKTARITVADTSIPGTDEVKSKPVAETAGPTLTASSTAAAILKASPRTVETKTASSESNFQAQTTSSAASSITTSDYFPDPSDPEIMFLPRPSYLLRNRTRPKTAKRKSSRRLFFSRAFSFFSSSSSASVDWLNVFDLNQIAFNIFSYLSVDSLFASLPSVHSCFVSRIWPFQFEVSEQLKLQKESKMYQKTVEFMSQQVLAELQKTSSTSSQNLFLKSVSSATLMRLPSTTVSNALFSSFSCKLTSVTFDSVLNSTASSIPCISFDHLFTLAQICPQITTLRFFHCRLFAVHIQVISGFRYLTELLIQDDYQVAKAEQQSHHPTASNNSIMDNQAVPIMKATAIEKPPSSIGKFSMYLIAKECPNLEKLFLWGFCGQSVCSVARTFSHFPNLRLLSIHSIVEAIETSLIPLPQVETFEYVAETPQVQLPFLLPNATSFALGGPLQGDDSLSGFDFIDLFHTSTNLTSLALDASRTPWRQSRPNPNQESQGNDYCIWCDCVNDLPRLTTLQLLNFGEEFGAILKEVSEREMLVEQITHLTVSQRREDGEVEEEEEEVEAEEIKQEEEKKEEKKFVGPALRKSALQHLNLLHQLKEIQVSELDQDRLRSLLKLADVKVIPIKAKTLATRRHT